MEPHRITFKPSVEKDLRRLGHDVIARVMHRVEALAEDPRPRGAIKLSGSKALYRIRVGDYRIVYQLDSPAKTIIINYIRHRRDAYRTR